MAQAVKDALDASSSRRSRFHAAELFLASEQRSDVVLEAIVPLTQAGKRGLLPRDKDKLLDRAIDADKGPTQLCALVRWALLGKARRDAFVDMAHHIMEDPGAPLDQLPLVRVREIERARRERDIDRQTRHVVHAQKSTLEPWPSHAAVHEAATAPNSPAVLPDYFAQPPVQRARSSARARAHDHEHTHARARSPTVRDTACAAIDSVQQHFDFLEDLRDDPTDAVCGLCAAHARPL